MIRITRGVLSFVQGLSGLACMGCALIETLRLVGPANVPNVGPYTFLLLAMAALAVFIVAWVADAFLSGLDVSRPSRRFIEFGAAAQSKVVDLDLCRRLADRDNRGLRGWIRSLPNAVSRVAQPFLRPRSER